MNSRSLVPSGHCVAVSSVRVIVLVLVMVSLASGESKAESAGGHQNVLVMTQNDYLGADLSPIFSATDPAAVAAAAAVVWGEVQGSDIPRRAAKIGDEIAAAQPDLVALQETVQWLLNGSVQFDFLQSILDELDSRGAHYSTIGHPLINLTASLPVAGIGVVTFVDREALLARTDLPSQNLSISNIQAEHFSTIISVPISVPIPGSFLPIPRGWISADVSIRGNTFRFITTQLESINQPIDPTVQVAQAAELLSGPANTTLPVVMAGDFNSNANGMEALDNTPTYDELLAGGLDDIWTEVDGHKIGNTCCQAANLLNFPSELFERIDLVLVNGGIQPVLGRDTGIQNGSRISAPDGRLWPSDHAGLVSMLKIP